jgi:succinate dehydrogenase / fumarate reductase iron-sulfur subunit
MVALTLPKNSKVREGKTWPKPEGATNLREYRIYRWSPDDGENPSIDTYYVDMDDCGPMSSTRFCGSRTRSTRR